MCCRPPAWRCSGSTTRPAARASATAFPMPRLRSASTRRGARACDGTECLDEVMLEGLDARIAALPPERRSKGRGAGHAPDGQPRPGVLQALDRPSSSAFCPSARPSRWPSAAMPSWSMPTTTRSPTPIASWAAPSTGCRAGRSRFDTGLLYMSDHGESLGEYGLFLHGLPYALAPEVQKHVPMVAWFSDGRPGAMARRSIA